MRSNVLMLVSQCPGGGKTTICNELMEHFGNLFHVLAQDNIEDRKNACKIFNQDILEIIADNKEQQIIVLDKNNHNSKVREATFSIDERKDNNTYYVVFEHSGGKQAFSTSAYNRIRDRKNHPTLSEKDALSAITTLSREYQPLTEEEIKVSKGIIKLDISKTRYEVFKSLCTQLKNFDLIEDVPTDEEIKTVVDYVRKEYK